MKGRERIIPLAPIRNAFTKDSAADQRVTHAGFTDLSFRIKAIWVAELKLIIGEQNLPDNISTWRRISEVGDMIAGTTNFILDRGLPSHRMLLSVSVGIRQMPWRGKPTFVQCAILKRPQEAVTFPNRAQVLRKDAWQYVHSLQEDLADRGISVNVALLDQENLHLIVRNESESPESNAFMLKIRDYIGNKLVALPHKITVHTLAYPSPPIIQSRPPHRD